MMVVVITKCNVMRIYDEEACSAELYHWWDKTFGL